MSRQAVQDAIDECRRMKIETVARKLGIKTVEASGWLSSSCPSCGGTKRFQISIDDDGFFCRERCGVKGKGAIDLVMVTLRVEFLEAVKWLVGDITREISEAERAKRKRDAERAASKDESDKQYFRRKAVKDGIEIWKSATYEPDALRLYLAKRGLTEDLLPVVPKCLRYLPDTPYIVRRKLEGEDKAKPIELHRGPAMVAAIQAPNDKLICVHRTWFDVDAPNGKPQILFGDKKQTNKLTRGSQDQAAIRLITPPRYSTLVMAEGIENTLTAAAAWSDLLDPGTAFWAGISLPHMAGKMLRTPGRVPSGIPDMDDAKGFIPPPWIERLIFIQDGDSDPITTRKQLESGLRRAWDINPRLRTQIVHAGAGVDLNDVLMGRAA